MGSVTIPQDLMDRADLWENERVLVASFDSGARLWTYVIPAPAGSGRIEMNGAAARLIAEGERVIIMAFGLTETPIQPRVLICDPRDNTVLTTGF
jgi:aspartate 1-decarboxylase